MVKRKILLVDDHPVILDGYRNILQSTESNKNPIEIDTAGTCEDGYRKVKNAFSKQQYDIVFLDISLPVSIKNNIFSGEDLGIKIRKISPGTKLIVLTMYTENSRLYNIMKNLKPEGFLIKSDFSSDEFLLAYNNICKGETYYSRTVNEFIRKRFGNDYLLDEVDRKILYYLSKGIPTKDLTKNVNLSLAAIEKRKRNIKEILGVEKGTDIILIVKAKELGFV